MGLTFISTAAMSSWVKWANRLMGARIPQSNEKAYSLRQTLDSLPIGKAWRYRLTAELMSKNLAKITPTINKQECGLKQDDIQKLKDEFTSKNFHEWISQVIDKLEEFWKKELGESLKAKLKSNSSFQFLIPASIQDLAIGNIDGGIATAFGRAKYLLNVIPDVFQAQFGRTPSIDEIRKIFKNSYSILKTWAKIHVSLLVSTTSMFKRSSKDLPAITVFNIESDDFGQKLVFNNEHLQTNSALKEIVEAEREAYKARRRSEEEVGSLYAVGCPALHANNGQGRNGIELMMHHIDRCIATTAQS